MSTWEEICEMEEFLSSQVNVGDPWSEEDVLQLLSLIRTARRKENMNKQVMTARAGRVDVTEEQAVEALEEMGHGRPKNKKIVSLTRVYLSENGDWESMKRKLTDPQTERDKLLSELFWEKFHKDEDELEREQDRRFGDDDEPR